MFTYLHTQRRTSKTCYYLALFALLSLWNAKSGHAFPDEVTNGAPRSSPVHIDDDHVTALTHELAGAQHQNDRLPRPWRSAEVASLTRRGQNVQLKQK